VPRAFRRVQIEVGPRLRGAKSMIEAEPAERPARIADVALDRLGLGTEPDEGIRVEVVQPDRRGTPATVGVGQLVAGDHQRESIVPSRRILGVRHRSPSRKRHRRARGLQEKRSFHGRTIVASVARVLVRSISPARPVGRNEIT